MTETQASGTTKSIYFPNGLLEQITFMAQCEGRSDSNMVCRLCEEALEARARKANTPPTPPDSL